MSQSTDDLRPKDAPTSFVGTLTYLGPGMVLAAGLVGSGELVATTKAGAQAGIALLWVIVFGCVIKVFTQIELGRYTISEGLTTLAAFDRLPGPRLRAHWIIWLWLLMMVAAYGLLAGILGGVSQALAMTLPITGDFASTIGDTALPVDEAFDTRAWAVVTAVGTSLLLYFGRYALLEAICIALVFCFTLVTIGNAVALQTTDYAIPAADILAGLNFSMPGDTTAWLTALAAFGIIGVGGTDLIVYPYWCLQKGYARLAGPRSPDAAWATRARGWVRIMTTDALVSLCIYTLTTVAFYFIGAAVLNREGADPDGMQMVSTLAEAYVPVFGTYARLLFLGGALAVLYSSFLVANAGAALLFADCLKILGLIREDEQAQQHAVAVLSLGLPLLVLGIYWTGWNSVRLIVIGGLVQSIVLPVIGGCALYFRFRLTDPRLRPGRLWDAGLVLSCLSLLIAGLFSLYQVFN